MLAMVIFARRILLEPSMEPIPGFIARFPNMEPFHCSQIWNMLYLNHADHRQTDVAAVLGKHLNAEMPLKSWFASVSAARWAGPTDVRAAFGSADFVADNLVIFGISGNKYRLVANVSYTCGRVLVKFIGTHKKYDRIKPESV